MSELISETLRERADGDIHVERLLSAVHTGARRRRRLRLAVSACALVAVVAVGAAGGVAFVGTRGAPDGSATPTAPQEIPRPPLADGAPVAAGTPAVVGSDPTLFHLDLTGLDGWSDLRWRSRPGLEQLTGTATEAGGELFVEAGRSRDQLTGQPQETGPATVNGLAAEAVRIRPDTQDLVPDARAGISAVRWEAVPGVWVQVLAPGGPDAAMMLAERVRLDRTFRCAVPFRLVGLGSRARLVTCETQFSARQVVGGVVLHDGDRRVEFSVGVERSGPVPPTTETIGGRAVASVASGTRATDGPGGGGPGSNGYLVYPYDGGAGYFHAYFTTLDDPFLRSLVLAFQPVTDPDPRAWPGSPLG